MYTNITATNARSGFGAGSSNSSGSSSTKATPTMEQLIQTMSNDNTAKTFEFNRTIINN